MVDQLMKLIKPQQGVISPSFSLFLGLLRSLRRTLRPRRGVPSLRHGRTLRAPARRRGGGGDRRSRSRGRSLGKRGGKPMGNGKMIYKWRVKATSNW